MNPLDDAAIGQLIVSRMATSAGDPAWATAWVMLRILPALNDITQRLEAIHQTLESLERNTRR
jgi:hypothetical protein